MAFEDALSRQMFSQSVEKSYIDKVTAKEEVMRLRELIKKEELTVEDVGEILNLVAGEEAKFVAHTADERWVVLKYHNWICEFERHAMTIAIRTTKLMESVNKKKAVITSEHYNLERSNKQLIDNALKYLINIYVHVSRTSLSVKGRGFDKVLTTSYDLTYPPPQAPEAQKTSWFGLKKGQ